MRRGPRNGFTLIEMIIVVVIIGVLAAIAIPSFKKYLDSGRAAEAASMLGELRNREEAYKAEFGSYLSTGTSETNVFPTVGTCPSGVEPCAKYATTAAGATVPSSWTTLGVNTQKSSLYCGYVVIAGASGTAPTGTYGQNQLGSSNINNPWWYAVAICDNDRTKSANTTYYTAYNSSVMGVANEHQ